MIAGFAVELIEFVEVELLKERVFALQSNQVVEAPSIG